MTNNFWKPARRKKMKKKTSSNPFSLKVKPVKKKDMTWPQAKRKFPRLKVFGDADRDGVKNAFDCKPFDKKRQDKYFHGTSTLQGADIKESGLKPARKLPSHYKMSEKTETGHVYMFKKPHHAQTWAKVVSQRTGFPPEVLEVDADPKELERDYEMEFGESYKKEGEIPAEKIKKFEGDTSYPEENGSGLSQIRKLVRDEKNGDENND